MLNSENFHVDGPDWKKFFNESPPESDDQVNAGGGDNTEEEILLTERLQLQIFFILSVDTRDIPVEVSYIHWPKS